MNHKLSYELPYFTSLHVFDAKFLRSLILGNVYVAKLGVNFWLSWRTNLIMTYK